MDELVTIITPCYNGANFVRRLFESILTQTYSNIEFIFVNDGSTDETDDIVKLYKPIFQNKSINFIYIKQSNKGQAAAINRGLAVYKGKYVTWPDSDDYYGVPDAISKMVNVLKSSDNSVSTVYCQGVMVDEESLESIGIMKHRKAVVNNLFYNSIFEFDFWFTPGCYMAKSEILNKVLNDNKIYESRGGQNWQLFLPLFYGYRSLYIEEPLFNYLIRRNSHSRAVKSQLRDQLERLSPHEDILIRTICDLKGMNSKDKENLIKKIQEKYLKKRFCLTIKYKDKFLAERYCSQIRELGIFKIRTIIYRSIMNYPVLLKIAKKVLPINNNYI